MEKDKKIPKKYQTVMPYLIVAGADKFIAFMKEVFGAEETYKLMRDTATVMHAEIMIGKCTLMLADATEDYPSCPSGMFIYVEDADHTFNKAVEMGAAIVMKPSNQPYGRSGGVKDPFGNTWWITSPAEIKN